MYLLCKIHDPGRVSDRTLRCGQVNERKTTMRTFILLVLCGFSALGFTSARTVSELTGDGEITTTEFSDYSEQADIAPLPDANEIIWHYSEVSGLTQKIAPIGNNSDFVFTGGWYGGGRMFQGIDGNGTMLWMTEPEPGTNEYWTSLATGTVAAETTDIFYAIQKYNVYNDNGTPSDPTDDYLVSEDNTSVQLFNSSSVNPVWTYSGEGAFISASADSPVKSACSSDGSILAVGGAIDEHLAIHFFNSSSSTPFATYEDPALAYYPRQLRITADGSKCIFRTSATLYRVDTATGTLEASFSLGASTDCFAISPDGSVIAYGFTAARMATWDGTAYNLITGKAIPGYYGGAAAIAADNNTIYFGFYRNDYKTNKILRFDLSGSSLVWFYDYPIGSGSHQDLVEWMDCSDDGRWMVMGTWGCQTGGGDEVEVFDDENPTAPVFSINTPGSMFHVDISPDGRYITAAGKHVHANVMGSGTDVYFAEMDILGIEGAESSNSLSLLPINPNPATNQLNVSFSIPSSGTVSIGVFDLSGRMVQNLAETHMTAGSHSMSFATDLTTGVYFCHLSSKDESVTQKLVVAR